MLQGEPARPASQWPVVVRPPGSLIVAIGSLAVRAFGLTKAANYAISLAAAAMEMAMVDLADAMMGAEPGPGSRDNAMKTLTQESNAGHNGAFPPVGRTTVCVRSTSNCQTTRVCNTHTLDPEGPAVHPQRLSHHRCEPGDHEHCQHLVRETMAELKHVLHGAARTAGEQLERLAPFWAGARFSR